MLSFHDLATALRRIVKYMGVPSDDERAQAYLADAGDLIDLEMRMREVAQGRLHRHGS